MAIVIKSSEDLEKWLSSKPKNWAQIVAVRAALRVHPVVFQVVAVSNDRISSASKKQLILSNFRLGVVAWIACRSPIPKIDEIAHATAKSSRVFAEKAYSIAAAHSDFAIDFAADAIPKAVNQAIIASVEAAEATVSDSNPTTIATKVITRTINSTSSIAYAIAAVAARSAGYTAVATSRADAETPANSNANAGVRDAVTDAVAAIWSAVEADCVYLEQNGQSVLDLILEPLWLAGLREDPELPSTQPEWARISLSIIQNKNRGWDDCWQIPVQWYLALLPERLGQTPKSLFGERADINIATKPDEFWAITEDRTAEDVLREIAEIANWRSGLEGHSVEATDEADVFERAVATAEENLQLQVPAAFRFNVENGKFTARPPDNISTDPITAQDLLAECRRKAQMLAERLDRTNADQRVKDSVDALLDVLPEVAADLRPGLLRSRARSVEADAAAYSDPIDEAQELFPNAVAALLDLSETVRDLQGCFPQLRDIDAEILALDMAPADAEDVREMLDKVVEAASEHEALVDQSAIYALETMEAIAEEPASPSVKQKRIAEYALVVRNFVSTVARTALDNALTREAAKLSSEAYQKARPKIVDGIADGMSGMARPVTIIAISSFVYLIGGPIAGVVAIVAGFGKIDRLLVLAEKWLKKQATDASAEAEDTSDAADNEDANSDEPNTEM